MSLQGSENFPGGLGPGNAVAALGDTGDDEAAAASIPEATDAMDKLIRFIDERWAATTARHRPVQGSATALA